MQATEDSYIQPGNLYDLAIKKISKSYLNRTIIVCKHDLKTMES